MGTKSLDFDIPSHGCILITGPNGSGKSTRAEAVAHCIFGKSLRNPSGKATGWRVGEAGGIRVEWGDCWVERKVSKAGKTTLRSWLEDSAKYPTTTKHQAAIEEVVGGFEDWRRASYVTSKAGSRFTMATDKSRKEILERVMGLNRLADALKRVRADLRTARSENQLKEYAAKSEAEKLEMLKREIGAAVLPEPEHLDLDALREDAKAEVAKRNEISALIEKNSSIKTQTMMAVREAKSALIAAKSDLAECEKGVCNRCGQKIPSENDPAEMQARVDTAEKALGLAEQELQNVPNSADLVQQVAQISQNLAVINNKAKQYKADVAAWEASKEKQASRQTDIDDQVQAAADAKESADNAARHLEVLEICDKVLSPKGVRAKLLGQAVDSLNALLASYIQELCGVGAYVRVGLANDALNLDIGGISDALSYLALSDGQRCRVDFALGLALSALSRGQDSGSLPGMVFLDEAMDGLDLEGIEACAALVKKQSNSVATLLVSHNQEIINRFEGTIIQC